MRVERDELDGRRLLGGSPVVLVSTRWRDEVNIAPVAWHMPLSVIPPLLGIAVHPSRQTHDMIRSSEEFALNIPGPRLLDHVHYFGVVSGRDVNKVEASKLPTFTARRVVAPLLQHCIGWIECGLEDALPMGDHTLFVGRVAAVSVEEDAFADTWKLEDPELRPLHYLGGSSYSNLGEMLIARVKTTAEGAIDRPVPSEELSPDERERWEQEQYERRRQAQEAAEKAAEAGED